MRVTCPAYLVSVLNILIIFREEKLKFITFLIMQFYPALCHLPLRSKYIPQNLILKHFQSGDRAIAPSNGPIRVGFVLCLITEAEATSETSCFNHNKGMENVQHICQFSNKPLDLNNYIFPSSVINYLYLK
jgi:hypothetical protein